MAKGKMPKGLKIGLIVLGILTIFGGGYMLYMKRKQDRAANGNIDMTDSGRSSLGDAPPTNAGVNSNAGLGGENVGKVQTTPTTSGLQTDNSGLGNFLLGGKGSPTIPANVPKYRVHRVEQKPDGMVVITFHNRPAANTIKAGDTVVIAGDADILKGRNVVTKTFIDANGKLGGVFVKLKPAGGFSGLQKIPTFLNKVRINPEAFSNKVVVVKA